mmetsp:Transcript_25831/g.49047  ORF Transcript_25831/g.49047 Transcript_25831/m.49047 type:complete len:483 (-) Transcript_25831:203-1651(-)|eukprot:CAMPEP_0114233476 /NCGR_PEP_ID=MMETSP0058-20121206/5187_1 /TAXON_ID=36894 /ORGANISM="Pyramimonas parkeae, CCMP726" /LENGTH=482 /DNA_ID=CAMNT_0001345073 /DNA_START=331 /DNA_END=1779 /DNA_ORIENTATION=+
MFGLSDSNHTDSSTAFIGAQWARLEPQGDPPNARWGHASLAIAVPLHQSQPQPVLLVVGGFPSVTVEVWALTLRHLRWHMLHPLPLSKERGGLALHTAVACGNSQVVVFGGRDGTGKASNRLFVLDITTNKWSRATAHGQVPAPRESHAAAMVSSGAMAVVGGVAGRVWLDDAYVLDTHTWFWTAVRLHPIPPQIKGHTMVMCDWRVALVGGSTPGGLSQGTWLWDTVSMETCAADEAPRLQLTEHAAACGDELVYFFGGLSPSSQSDEECKGEVEPERLVCSNILRVRRRATLRAVPVEMDPTSALPCARRHPTLTLATDNSLLLFGGRCRNQDLQDLWVLYVRGGGEEVSVVDPAHPAPAATRCTGMPAAHEPLQLHPALLAGQARDARMMQVQSERTAVCMLAHELKMQLLEQDDQLSVAKEHVRNRTEWLEEEVERLSTGLETMQQCVQLMNEDLAARRESLQQLRDGKRLSQIRPPI